MTTTSMPLRDAQHSGDLIPGDIRAIAATQADLDRAGATLADTATALATLTPAWSGPAAAAFTRHARDVGDRLDQWDRAHRRVSQALADYDERLAAAQHLATRALVLWRTAHAHLARLSTPTAGASTPSNLDNLRAQLTAALQRATALLRQAQADIAAAGDDAARQVASATRQLLEQSLPTLADHVATTPAVQTIGVGLAAAVPGPTVTVQAPHAGVHDSLSRIAARTLGDARRWPEIYRLNAERLGRNPNLIQPGWILRLPPTSAPLADQPHAAHDTHGSQSIHAATAPAPAPSAAPLPRPAPTPAPSSGPAHGASPTTTPHTEPHLTAPHPTPPARPGPGQPGPLVDGSGHLQPTPAPAVPDPPHPPHQAESATVHSGSDDGVHLGNGLLLAGGVVAGLAGITGAAALLRHRHGTAAEDPDTVGTAGPPSSGSGPEVRRLAVDHTDHDTQPRSSTHVGSAVASSVTGVTSSGRPDQLDLPLGERDGRTVLLDAATTYGLGLTGPGALPTARALLLSVLTTHRGAHAILAADDLHALAPTASRTGRAVNRRLSVPAGPAEALAHLEAAILTRTRLLEESAGQHTPPPLLLVISVPTDPRRLQAIADLGAGLAIAVLVLGPWPAGLTCHIDAAGHITTQDATPDPDWSSTLHGLHAYAADADTTQELLALLAHDATRTADHRADATAQSIPHPAAPPVRHQPTAPPRPEHDPTPSDIAHRLAPGPDATPSQTTTAAALSTGGATSDTARSHAPRPRTPDSPTTHTPVKPIRLNLLGHFHVHYHASTTDTPRDITDRFSPRERDILTYLALHPDGTRRDSLIVALWPDNPGDRPSASLHARLSHIRHTLRTVTDHHIDTLTTHHDGYYALDPATVEVDLWQLTDALHTHYHATDPRERTAALHEIAQLYQGQLADTITGEWIDTARQALHRDALDAFAALIRTVRDTDPEHALELLEHARTLDRHNEAIYRDIIRLQTRLGHHDSIPRTVELLRTALAEIDATPMASTLALASGAHGTTSDTTPDTP